MPRTVRARPRVALLIETSNRYGRDLLHGVHDWVAQGDRWAVRLTEMARRAPLPAWVRDWHGDGIIARVDTPAGAAVLQATGLPVVDVSAERGRSEFPRVSIDNVAVARMAVAHFAAKNLRHFGYCGNRRFLWSRLRGRAFGDLVRGRGGSCSFHEGGPGLAEGAGTDADLAGLASWLARLPKPAGVFACYDGRAQQVLEACQLAGLAVPEEVAVLGVDNDEVLCELCDPPLSSILPNARRTGYEAAAILGRLMAGRTVSPMPSLEVEPLRVVERQSTDAVAVEDARVAAAVRFIRLHAGEGIDVADLLRAVPMSRTLLERRFKALMGVSPHRMIKQQQVDRARQMLAETDLPVARVADLTGFGSPSYLSAAFRRETGESPLSYRARRRAGRA